MQRAKEMLWSSQAKFYTIPLKSETHDTTSHTGIKPPLRSLSLSSSLNKTNGLSQNKDSVPNDFPAITTSSFLQRYVPMNATIAHVSAMTAATNATMTQVPATRSATMNAPKYQLDKWKATRAQNKMMSLSILHPAKRMANHAIPRYLLRFFVQNNPAITISSLLLFHVKDSTVITTSTHDPSLLLLYHHDNPAIMTALIAQISCYFLFKTIQQIKPRS
jgi:hypothetical protein